MNRFGRIVLLLLLGVLFFCLVSFNDVLMYTLTVANEMKHNVSEAYSSNFQLKMIEDVLPRKANKLLVKQNCSGLVISGRRETLSRQTGLYKSAFDEEFLSGINESTNNSLFAVCEFVYTAVSPHFAHAFAQFYRCFSWWNANANKKPVLLYDRSLNGGDRHSTQFEAGFLKAMEDVFGVLIQRNFSAPAVRIGKGNFGMLGSVDTQRLRSGIVTFYNLSDENEGVRGKLQKNMAVIGVLNRLRTRSIKNPDDIYLELTRRSLNSSLFRVRPVEYFESKSFLEQVEYFSSTDIIPSAILSNEIQKF